MSMTNAPIVAGEGEVDKTHTDKILYDKMRYLLVRVALAFGCGAVAGRSIGQSLPPWIWPVLAAVAVSASIWRRRSPVFRQAALLAAVFCFGVLRVATDQDLPDSLRLKAASLQAIEGTVVSYPNIGSSHISFTLRPVHLAARIRITWFSDAPPIGVVHYGDHLRVVGVAEVPQPFEGFDYPAYLARQGIFATMAIDEDELEVLGRGRRSLLVLGDRIRQVVLERLDQRLRPDQSAVARSLLFGDRTALPEPIEEAFSRSGLMHLLAVSGLHLGIFLGGAWWALRRLGLRPRVAYPLVGVLVLVVLWIVGPRVSLIRAAMLFAFLALGSVLADLGLMLRRSIRSLNGLAAAAITMLALRPAALFDVGFQLTFAATASILIAFSAPLEWGRWIADDAERFGRWRILVRPVLMLAAVSCAAQAGATPVIAWHFETFHPLALVGNLLALPLAGLALWCGLGAILVSGTPIFSAAIVPFSTILNVLQRVVTGLSGVPYSQLEVPRWLGLWLGGAVVYAFAVVIYERESSS